MKPSNTINKNIESIDVLLKKVNNLPYLKPEKRNLKKTQTANKDCFIEIKSTNQNKFSFIINSKQIENIFFYKNITLVKNNETWYLAKIISKTNQLTNLKLFWKITNNTTQLRYQQLFEKLSKMCKNKVNRNICEKYLQGFIEYYKLDNTPFNFLTDQ